MDIMMAIKSNKKYIVFHKKTGPWNFLLELQENGFNIEKTLVQAIYTYD